MQPKINPDSIKKRRDRNKTLEEKLVLRIMSRCQKQRKFVDNEYKENLEEIAKDGEKIKGAIVTYEEHLNANNTEYVTLDEIKDGREYYSSLLCLTHSYLDNENARIRNIDNFLNKDVINKFKNENFLNSLYLTHMTNKTLWKPDKFKMADKLVYSIQKNQ